MPALSTAPSGTPLIASITNANLIHRPQSLGLLSADKEESGEIPPAFPHPLLLAFLLRSLHVLIRVQIVAVLLFALFVLLISAYAGLHRKQREQI